MVSTQIWIAKWVLFELFIYGRRTKCKLQCNTMWRGGRIFLNDNVKSITPAYIFTVDKVYIYTLLQVFYYDLWKV